MVSSHEEIEITYDLGVDADLPALAALLQDLPDAAVHGYREGDLGEHELEAMYFDTADLRLDAASITLRRRTGGPDAGWHLKTPGDDSARLEQAVPLGRAVKTVPAPLRRLIEEHTAGQPLVPVAVISTRRHVRSVLDATGTRLLELADDVVQARRLLPLDGPGEAAATVQHWREVELELIKGDRALFAAVDAGLRAAGLQVASSSSKVGRVLARAGETALPAPAAAQRVLEHAGPRRTDLSTRSKAGEVLIVHLAEQVQQILDQDPRVRRDEADSIHKMRVATRRLRSALRTFQPLLQAPTKPVRDELRWLAAELGAARDAEVLRDRLVAAVASLDVPTEQQPPDPAVTDSAVTAAVPTLVADQLGTAYRSAHDQVLTELDSERYQHLLDTLQDLIEHPALSARGLRRAERVLPRRVAKTFTTLADLVEQAHRAEAGTDRDELLHEARKTAKAVRYAAEAVSVVFGKDATRFARAATDVQEVLGEHQDSVVTRQRLRDLAATTHPEVAFAYGRLFAQEQAHALATETDFQDTWAAMGTKRLHRWLR